VRWAASRAECREESESRERKNHQSKKWQSPNNIAATFTEGRHFHERQENEDLGSERNDCCT